MEAKISLEKHRIFFRSLQKGLPEASHSSYMTALFFTISGSSLLQVLDPQKRAETIDWVYRQQIREVPHAGFRANPSTDISKPSQWDFASLASTYSALCILKLLGDDFSRVFKAEIIDSVREHITTAGSARSHQNSSENDIRFVYCAACICFMLNDWTGIDKDLIERFILSCQTKEGGFSIYPGFEAHGGGTYCAVSSLYLMERLENIRRKDLVEWLVMRQGYGYSGRPGKAEDTCYGYWIGLSLKILGEERFITEENLKFYLECETDYGGFSKYPGVGKPDLTHSYLGLVALTLLGVELEGVFPALGIVY